jgi:hypothetical protein
MSAAIDVGTTILAIIGAVYVLLFLKVLRQDRAARVRAETEEWKVRVAAMKRLEELDIDRGGSA